MLAWFRNGTAAAIFAVTLCGCPFPAFRENVPVDCGVLESSASKDAQLSFAAKLGLYNIGFTAGETGTRLVSQDLLDNNLLLVACIQAARENSAQSKEHYAKVVSDVIALRLLRAGMENSLTRSDLQVIQERTGVDPESIHKSIRKIRTQSLDDRVGTVKQIRNEMQGQLDKLGIKLNELEGQTNRLAPALNDAQKVAEVHSHIGQLTNDIAKMNQSLAIIQEKLSTLDTARLSQSINDLGQRIEQDAVILANIEKQTTNLENRNRPIDKQIFLYFDDADIYLRPDSKNLLAHTISEAQLNHYAASVVGFADQRGAISQNRLLSQQRADHVAELLRLAKVPVISSTGAGATRSFGKNPASNRVVQIHFHPSTSLTVNAPVHSNSARQLQP